MKKKNLKLKAVLTLDDKAKMIEDICTYIIGDGNNPNAVYMPYIFDYALTIVIAKYAVEGLSFTAKENIYKKVIGDEEVSEFIEEFKETRGEDMGFIETSVWDIVDFRKRKLLSPTHELEAKLLEILNTQKAFEDLRLTVLENENKVLKQQIKANEYQEEIYSKMTPEETAKLNKMMLEDGFDVNKIADIMMEKYIASDAFNTNKDSIIESKNVEIRDLQKYKLAHEARNVIADK